MTKLTMLEKMSILVVVLILSCSLFTTCGPHKHSFWQASGKDYIYCGCGEIRKLEVEK